MMTHIHSKIWFGGGCFWHIESKAIALEGVCDVVTGYSGGHVDSPSESDILTGLTGHAEVCEITYNSEAIDLKTLLLTLFSWINPTLIDRQGADIGHQYRSIILWQNANDLEIIRQVVKEVQSQYRLPVQTEIQQFQFFWPAAEHHQRHNQKLRHLR